MQKDQRLRKHSHMLWFILYYHQDVLPLIFSNETLSLLGLEGTNTWPQNRDCQNRTNITCIRWMLCEFKVCFLFTTVILLDWLTVHVPKYSISQSMRFPHISLVTLATVTSSKNKVLLPCPPQVTDHSWSLLRPVNVHLSHLFSVLLPTDHSNITVPIGRQKIILY